MDHEECQCNRVGCECCHPMYDSIDPPKSIIERQEPSLQVLLVAACFYIIERHPELLEAGNRDTIQSGLGHVRDWWIKHNLALACDHKAAYARGIKKLTAKELTAIRRGP